MASAGQSFVHFRPAPPHLAECVREAVEALGYYRPEAADAIVEFLTEQWPNGVSKDALRRANLDVYRTDKREPRSNHARHATMTRTILNVQKRDQLLKEPQWATSVSSVRLAGLSPYTCDQAKALMGKVTPREGRFSLPLAECGSEWCGCRWDHEPDDED